MKIQLFLIPSLLVSFVLLVSSCTSKTTEVTSEVSQNPPEVERVTFWIDSDKQGSVGSQNGLQAYKDCYLLNYKSGITAESLMYQESMQNDNFEQNEIYCDEISELNYKEGNFYQVEATKYYLGKEITGIKVERVLQEIEDVHYKKVEELIIFVGPNKEKMIGFSGQELDCLNIQQGGFSASKEWDGKCGNIQNFEYVPGFTYKLKVRRSHLSKFDTENIQDLMHSYTDSLIELISKEAVAK